MTSTATSRLFLGNRAALFWLGCAAITVGVLLHLPMLAMAHRMGNHLAGMAMDAEMLVGMGLIVGGAALACWGALPARAAPVEQEQSDFEAADDQPLNRSHVAVLVVLTLGLVIDVMKPATLGFVLPGLRHEYGIEQSTAALLPLAALTGTTVGSFLWGWLADIYGRRVSILLSAILFASTAICGAMPSFEWNLAMCFLMGSSAGGMLPVIYTLLSEVMPPRHRSWILVLVGGTGLIGGYLAASGAAHALEPTYGWRSLWLQGFPTGLLLLALARFIPETPRFLVQQGRTAELAAMQKRFGLVRVERPVIEEPGTVGGQPQLTAALVIAALCWSFVNFGLLLWLPSDLQDRGYSAALASGLLAKSSLIALPTIALAAFTYSRLSSRWTLVATILLTLAGLLGALLPSSLLQWEPLLVTVIATLIVGTNGTIAVIIPYTAENYPLHIRGRATGLVAGSSKFGGVSVQLAALLGFIPTLVGAAWALAIPTAASAAMLAWAGRKTRGSKLSDLEKRA